MSWGWLIVIFIVGWAGGWVEAHNRVAKECNVFGHFYVGTTEYTCTTINDHTDESTE